MKLSTIALSSLAAAGLFLDSPVAASDAGSRLLRKSKSKPSKSRRGSKGKKSTLKLAVTNLAYQQPFSPFFVMVHSEDTEPIFNLGDEPSKELALLAENGDPKPLVKYYKKDDSVLSVTAFDTGAPFELGDIAYIDVEVDDYYDRVTIASMAIHTNDCFVALNGVKVNPGDVYNANGLDAGSEENNEECNSIPGPACNEFSTDNKRSGNGEGYVHVHRGFFGVGGDLSESGYDWRNPMMQVAVMKK